MSKQGIYKISGNTKPKVGERVTYKIDEWYPATPLEKRNPALVTWHLFKKINGKFVPTNIRKKGVSSFTFNTTAYKDTFRIEAYLHNPEGKAPMALEIQPQPSDVPRINKVELKYIDDTPGSVFSFTEKLVVEAKCMNLEGQYLQFTLWEDDALDSGHNNKNLLIDSKKEKVKNGTARAEFLLTKALMKKAMEGETDPKQLEFYVTVEYYAHKKHATDNVNVNTPASIYHPSSKPNPKPAPPQPKTESSPAEQKGQSQKEQKGIIESATETIAGAVSEIGKKIYDWAETKGKIKKDQKPTPPPPTGENPAIVQNQQRSSRNCGGKYCIDKNSPPSELILEINIRLAGFGGNVPTNTFTDRTEKMVKQFQRDYMKVPETGKVCGNVLRAIDEFGINYAVDINEAKCPCKECDGFGNGLYSDQKNNPKISEKNRKYEYPGIHRSLLWVEKAIKFYLASQEKQLGLKVGLIFSGYRCNSNNRKNKRSSTNHMGKALDLHIYKLNDRNNTEKNADKIRDILTKYTNAEYRWGGKNVFALEPSSRNRIGEEFIATTWVHYDVRTFSLEYLKDEYFVKDNNKANGENIVALANRLGFQNTCLCNTDFVKSEKEKTSSPKYKWSHSEFGNLIAMHESSDDYNKCNQTKGGLKVINNVNVVGLTIKEIQQKQIDRDVFAVGRYQLIPDTLKEAVTSLGLDVSQKLDEEMQDKIFDDYLIKVKRPKIIAYLEGNGSVEDAMYVSAMEWASIGVQKGKRISDKVIKKDKKVIKRIIRYAAGGESYYAGDGLNKAHITPNQIKNALINSKNANQ